MTRILKLSFLSTSILLKIKSPTQFFILTNKSLHVCIPNDFFLTFFEELNHKGATLYLTPPNSILPPPCFGFNYFKIEINSIIILHKFHKHGSVLYFKVWEIKHLNEFQQKTDEHKS